MNSPVAAQGQTPDAAFAKLIEEFIRDVAELPDRTSPEDWPEAMLITGAELKAFLESFIFDYERIEY